MAGPRNARILSLGSKFVRVAHLEHENGKPGKASCGFLLDSGAGIMSAGKTESKPATQAEAVFTDGLEIPTASQVMAHAGGENFPVAAFFLPAHIRRHLLNLYGFARLADELGDASPGDRIAHLDWLERELGEIYEGSPYHPLMRRLAQTAKGFDIPSAPFRDLIQANRQDQTVKSYEDIAGLIGYCSLSANPVGRLVLYVVDAATEERFELSDHICTGLQLVEHWQDVAEDFDAGRIYIPREDMDRFGVSEETIGLRRTDANFRRLMAFEVDRARKYLDAGAPLANTISGRLRLAIVAFIAGGRAALSAIERRRYDVLRQSPRPSKLRRAAEFLRTFAQLRGG